jgi:hypothetical protein
VVVALAGAHEAALDVHRMDVADPNGQAVHARRLVDRVEPLATGDDPLGKIADDPGRPLGPTVAMTSSGCPTRASPIV